MAIHLPSWQLRARFALSLADMYGREVPAYKDLVEVSRNVNAEVATRLGSVAEDLGSLDRVSAERHGAIRVGSPGELRWISRLFAHFGMYPVGFYDLREAAATSAVPVISTAFRPVDRVELAHNPFRVFTSMLITDDRRFFHDPTLQAQIEAAIAHRQMFGRRLQDLIEEADASGGVSDAMADEFLREATGAFALPSHAVDQSLYDAIHRVSPVAADIFFGLNINHLTPRVLDIDEVNLRMERDRKIKMKDQVEGPPRRQGVDVLLRQTSFRSLPELIRFLKADGSVAEGTRRVRFGEIEQRGVALTPAGRQIYDDLLEKWEQEWARNPGGDYQTRWAERFDAEMPRTYAELARRNLAYFTYHATARGYGAKPGGQDLHTLVANGFLERRPIVYEDFLPKSAAGIFNSNLGTDLGKRHDAAQGSDKGAHTLAEAIGRAPMDPYALYAAEQTASLVTAEAALGLAAGSLGAPFRQ